MDVGEARALSELLELIHQPRIAHCGGAPAGILARLTQLRDALRPVVEACLPCIKLKMRGNGGLGKEYEKINRTIGNLRYAATFINEGSNRWRL